MNENQFPIAPTASSAGGAVKSASQERRKEPAQHMQQSHTKPAKLTKFSMAGNASYPGPAVQGYKLSGTRYMKTIFCILIAAVDLAAKADPETALYFTSSSHSWVGQGLTLFATPTNGFTFNVTYTFDVLRFLCMGSNVSSRWEVDFNAGFGAGLTVGEYPDAVREGGNTTNPGLSFYGEGRGDNTLSGSFNVLDFTLGTNDTVLSFAADFVQYDEGNTSAWNMGSVRYNSIVPIPEPAFVKFVGLCCCVGAYRRSLTKRPAMPNRGSST